MNASNFKKFFPSLILFILLTLMIIFLSSLLEKNGFNINFLLIANGLLFLLSASAFFLQARAINSNNPQKFVRGVYASMMIKMFICMIAVLIYVVFNKHNINKPALFTSMGIYILYTIIEVSGLMKAVRNKKHA